MAKILLVEDNEINRDMLSRRLLKRGYESPSPSMATRASPWHAARPRTSS